jgi:hypothetical protein
MCPACLGSAPVMAAGAVSTGGLTHTMAWVRHHDRYENAPVDASQTYSEPKKAGDPVTWRKATRPRSTGRPLSGKMRP